MQIFLNDICAIFVLRKPCKPAIVAAHFTQNAETTMVRAFKVGDVVRANVGGLWMTIEGFDDDAGDIVRCKWFEGKNRFEQPFPKESIQLHPVDLDPTKRKTLIEEDAPE